jgi:hypothetical protein
MTDVRASSWLSFASRERSLEVEARSTGDAVEVVVYEADREGRPEHARGRVELMASPPPLRRRLHIADALSPSRWAPGDLYGRGMFHGPAFQVLSSLSRRSTALSASLKEPSAPLFGDGRRPLLPVALLDGIGQAIGLVRAEEELAMCFPTGVDRLELAPVSGASGPYELVARFEPDGPRGRRSDAELRAADGAVLLSVRGRRDQDAQLPPHFWNYRADPFGVAFSRSIRDLFRDVPGVERCAIVSIGDFAGGFLTEADGLWALDLSRYVLGREERAAFEGFAPGPSRLGWLLERAVMKDAARWLSRGRVTMADVVIREDERGTLTAHGPSPLRPAPVAADADGYEAVGVAGDGTEIAGVGAAIAAEPETAARRAAARALGCREAFELEVRGLDAGSGRFEVMAADGRKAVAFSRGFGARTAAICIVSSSDVGFQGSGERTERQS